MSTPPAKFQWPIERVRPIHFDKEALLDATRGDFGPSDALAIQADAGAFALSPASAIVTAVAPLEDGSFSVTLDHGRGLESRLGGLEDVFAPVGLHVERGAAIGTVASGRDGKVPVLTLRAWLDGDVIEPIRLIDAYEVQELPGSR